MSTQCTRSNVLIVNSCSLRVVCMNDPSDERTPIPAQKDDRRRIYRRSCHPKCFAILITCILPHRPLKCSEPMLCVISCKYRRMRASKAVHSRESFGEDAWMAFQERSGSLLNAESHSCSSRCWSLLWASLAARSGRMGIRPRLPPRSVRQSRCVLHYSHHFAAKQTMSSERSAS